MRTRTLQIATFLLLVAPIGGCQLSGTERIAQLQAALEWAQARSQDYDARMAAIEAALASAQARLADPNLTSDTVTKLRADVNDLQARLAAVKGVKAVVDKAAGEYQAQLAAALAAGDVTPEQEWALYGRGVSALAPALGPYGVWAGLIGTLLPVVGAVAGAFAKGKVDQTAIKGIVRSVDKLLASDKVSDVEAAKDILAREQVKTPGAAAAVRRVKEAA